METQQRQRDLGRLWGKVVWGAETKTQLYSCESLYKSVRPYWTVGTAADREIVDVGVSTAVDKGRDGLNGRVRWAEHGGTAEKQARKCVRSTGDRGNDRCRPIPGPLTVQVQDSHINREIEFWIRKVRESQRKLNWIHHIRGMCYILRPRGIAMRQAHTYA